MNANKHGAICYVFYLIIRHSTLATHPTVCAANDRSLLQHVGEWRPALLIPSDVGEPSGYHKFSHVFGRSFQHGLDFSMHILVIFLKQQLDYTAEHYNKII